MNIDKATIKEFQSHIQEQTMHIGDGKNLLEATKNAVDKALLFMPLDMVITSVSLETIDNRVRLYVRYADKYISSE